MLWCWVWGVEDRRELFQQESTQSKDWSCLRVSFTEILRTSAHFTLFGRQLVSLYMLIGTMLIGIVGYVIMKVNSVTNVENLN